MDDQRLIRIFRYFITASWLLGLVAFVIDWTTWDTLPPLLQEYYRLQESREFTTADNVLVIAALPLLILFITSLIGLYRFWRKAPMVFVISNVLVAIWSLFTEPEVSTLPASFFSFFAMICIGVVIGMTFFSPLNQQFRRGMPNRSLKPTANREDDFVQTEDENRR